MLKTVLELVRSEVAYRDITVSDRVISAVLTV